MAIDDRKARIESLEMAKARVEAEKKKLKEEELAKQRKEILEKMKSTSGQRMAGPVTKPGMPSSKVGIPGMRPGSVTAPTAPKIIARYTVKKGDTLSQIAKSFYGSGSQPYWKLIQEANKDIIKDANLIYPGQVFNIPELPEELKKK